MEKGERPIGREKHVTGQKGSVHRRGDGLQEGGPAGSREGWAGREGQGTQSDNRGLTDDLTGGAMQSGTSNIQRQVEGMVLNEVVNEVTGRKKKNPLFLGVIVITALFLVFGGKGTLSSLLGSGIATGISEDDPLSSVYSGSMNSNYYENSSSSNSSDWATGTAGSSVANGTLNREVSDGARAKRTTMVGGGKDQITIMIYMCGTDLESKYGMATSDLQEMANATISDQINLLVYTGGCAQWKNNIVSSSTNQIYQVKSGGVECLEKDMGSSAMTDPNTLSAYIKWAKKEFPADRYDLILWDHGGGSTSGYGYDQLYANSGSMTLDKIATALKGGGCKFDFIGFDACLMATLENALVVEPYADYLIASEETEPGVGWYYTNWLTKLSENTSMSTLDIGKIIVDDFVNVCAQKTSGEQTTLSVTDLAELHGTVPDKFKNFAASTTELMKSNQYQVVSNARSVSKEFAKSVGIDQVDLMDLADHIGTEEAAELSKVLRSAVKYNLTSNNVSNAYGMSIYFPYGKLSSVNTMANTYSKIGLDTSYTNCIKSFASLEAGGQVTAGGNNAQLSSLFGTLLSNESSSSQTAESDAVSSLIDTLLSGRSLPSIGVEEDQSDFLDQETLEANTEYLTNNQFDTSNLVWMPKNGQDVLQLTETQWGLIQKVELNVFVDDGEGYIDLGLDNIYNFDADGDLIGYYDGTWMGLEGQIVAYYLLSAEGDSSDYQITGRIPAILNGNQNVDIILTFTDEQPYGRVLGARMRYDEKETETQAKGLIALEPGNTIDFVCDYYSYNRIFIDSYKIGEQIVVDGSWEIGNIELYGSNYTAAYRLTDQYNNHYWTPKIGG